MLEKREFNKRKEIIGSKTHLGINDQENRMFEVWVDPPNTVLRKIVAIKIASKKEIEDEIEMRSMMNEWAEGVCQVFFDSDIPGINFDDPETMLDAFINNESLPRNFLGRVVIAYAARAFSQSESVKKNIIMTEEPQNSGLESQTENDI